MSAIQQMIAGYGGAPDMSAVFSSSTYTGNGTSQSISNGVDLAGSGGLVWIRRRSSTSTPILYDTKRGTGSSLASDSPNAANTGLTTHITSFDSGGFSIGSTTIINTNLAPYISWTIGIAAKFFDVVTYTGNSGGTQSIAHSLGGVPGAVIVKNASTGATEWRVWHRGVSSGNYIVLNTTAIQTTSGAINRFGNNTTTVDPTSTHFTVGSALSASTDTYVAYLFGHNTATNGGIQCGSYTGNGSTSGPTITLGWRPQFLVIKRATGSTGNWLIMDSVRGLGAGDEIYAHANSSTTEASADLVSTSSMGFGIVSSSTEVNGDTNTYIYIAIRE